MITEAQAKLPPLFTDEQIFEALQSALDDPDYGPEWVDPLAPTGYPCRYEFVPREVLEVPVTPSSNLRAQDMEQARNHNEKFDLDKTYQCIAGYVIKKLDPEGFEHIKDIRGDFSSALRNLCDFHEQPWCSDAGFSMIQSAQSRQDGTETWGEAVAAAWNEYTPLTEMDNK